MAERFLLDTQVWLWWNLRPERLNEQTRQLLKDTDNEPVFSIVTAWEIVIKHMLGKLELPTEPTQYIHSRLDCLGLETLDVRLPHVLEVQQLPFHHADPFDRLLIAQARAEGLPLLTADRVIPRYALRTIKAD